jgi:hypothetical protein
MMAMLVTEVIEVTANRISKCSVCELAASSR